MCPAEKLYLAQFVFQNHNFSAEKKKPETKPMSHLQEFKSLLDSVLS